ncbi:hypothetical protein FRC05_002907 [Tulasnella sp. 425]|nr:hypothetical protein FRC05_002907 [Tulasnella sp. 425]
MTSSSPPHSSDDKVKLPETVVHALTPDTNPWQDIQQLAVTEAKPTPQEHPPQEIEVPPNAFNDAMLPPTPSKRVIDTTLLNEFDPLADKVESNARDAWASSEAHPPAPAPPPKPTPQQFESKGGLPNLPMTPKHQHRPSTTLDPPTSAAAQITTFATLASLARAPFGRRSRASSLAQNVVPAPEEAGSSAPPTPSKSSAPLPQPPPATPAKDHDRMGDPSKPDPPFDFQKFLDQMKMKSAEPVAKYLRSFLNNFAKRNFTVNDQIKLIREFLDFITAKMREVEPWRKASEAEFDNATEAMEKLVMNRLYDYTFTPQIDQTAHPVTTDDLERDHVLRQRMKLFGWIREEHLDVPTELLKMNHYKAPRDKVICILNCCKVIFGLIRHLHKDEGADSFIPILIFVVLKANPEHLMSNIEYAALLCLLQRVELLIHHYVTGAVNFIETMDHTALSKITQEEFENNVEAAIQALPPSPAVTDRNEDPSRIPTPPPSGRAITPQPVQASNHAGEEPAIPLKLPSTATIAEDTKRFFQRTGDSISKPLTAIGKIFNEAMDGLDELERQREQSRIQQERAAAAPNGSPGDASILSQFGPEWLFGNPSPRPSTPQTPLGGGAPVTPSGPQQAPYRPRVRPGSSGSPGGSQTPEATPQRNSWYQIPPLSFQPPQQTPGTPSNLSRSLPQEGYMRTPPSAPRPLPHQAAATLPPRTRQQFVGEYAGSDPGSRPGSPLDLSALQEEIDRAHSLATQAARGTLVQMFPTCEPEVIDMVLEANRGDLGPSIESLLEMMTP